MSFCLPTEFVNKFIDALKSGAIDPEKLSKMTSADRREYLGKIVGEADAREVNALFEKTFGHVGALPEGTVSGDTAADASVSNVGSEALPVPETLDR